MKNLSISIFLLITLSCSNSSDGKRAPIRVQGIPEKAFWAGGLDGGNWYVVEHVHDHRNNAIIKVFNDQDGSLIISKRFSLICPESNMMLIENLEDQINSFDGQKIYLKYSIGKEGCFLQ